MLQEIHLFGDVLGTFTFQVQVATSHNQLWDLLQRNSKISVYSYSNSRFTSATGTSCKMYHFKESSCRFFLNNRMVQFVWLEMDEYVLFKWLFILKCCIICFDIKMVAHSLWGLLISCALIGVILLSDSIFNTAIFMGSYKSNCFRKNVMSFATENISPERYEACEVVCVVCSTDAYSIFATYLQCKLKCNTSIEYVESDKSIEYAER